MKVNEEPLSWIGDNKAKGIAQKHTIVTIHSSHAYAREHLESGEEAVKATLVAAAEKHLDSKVVESFYQRWRYALAESPFESPFFFSRRHGLLLAGDSFGGGRVENAALSGIEAAAHLVDFL
jgi:renalase